MLERLVASDRPRGVLRSTPGAVLSVTVHGLLIAGAVVASRPPASPAVSTVVTDPIPIIFAPPTTAPRGTDQSMTLLPVVDQGAMGGLRVEIEVPIEVPTGIPEPDLRRVFGRPGRGREVGPLWSGPAGDPSAPILATVADEPPVLLTSPAPVYPALLRDAGIEGTVVMEMVVDEEGRPEIESLRVLSSGHALFEAAARRVVLAARYRPGRWRGRPVRVLIRQPVEFRLSER